MKLKSILLSALAVGASLASFSQCSGLTIEAHEELDGMVGTADLTGYTVYRVYAEMENEDDVLCALYGLIAMTRMLMVMIFQLLAPVIFSNLLSEGP